MKSLNSVILFFAILAVAGAGLFFFPQSPFYYKTLIVVTDDSSSEAAATNTAAATDEGDVIPQDDADEDIAAEVEEEVEAASTAEAEGIVAEAEMETAAPSEVIAPEAVSLIEKKLGSDDAPVKIMEFSSLSCGHCGNFHTEVYPEIKKNYVDTGKVQIIMIDFPLNFPALQGAMLAHCLPDDQYFNFLQLLFTTQTNWLSGDHEAKLKQNAQLAGLSAQDVEACLENKELEEQIVSRTEDVQAKWGVSSTPTFIFNDGFEKIEGNRPYEEFVATIDRALKNEE